MGGFLCLVCVPVHSACGRDRPPSWFTLPVLIEVGFGSLCIVFPSLFL